MFVIKGINRNKLPRPNVYNMDSSMQKMKVFKDSLIWIFRWIVIWTKFEFDQLIVDLDFNKTQMPKKNDLNVVWAYIICNEYKTTRNKAASEYFEKCLIWYISYLYILEVSK